MLCKHKHCLNIHSVNINIYIVSIKHSLIKHSIISSSLQDMIGSSRIYQLVSYGNITLVIVATV